MHLPSITAALALVGLSAAAPTEYTTSSSSSSKDVGLAQAWTSKGRQYIGTALTIRDDPVEQGIIQSRADFNSITPENAMKWESTEPQRNNFTFAGADAVADFADKYHKEMRCHTLVWHSQLPAWVSQGGFDNKTLISIMENHIKKVAGRYKNKCTHWDVVNEALEEDGTYRKSVFYNTIGEAFIPIAFRFAEKYAGSKTKLFYNDYNLEYGSAKALGAQRILKLVQSYGVQIDGVGLQAHLSSEATASTGGGVTPDVKTLTNVLKLYTDLGVEVAYTELDVRFTTPATPAKLKAQADAYARVVQSCINVKQCVGITIWGVSDKYSWIPGVFKTEGAALLWDENFNKKPAYTELDVRFTTPATPAKLKAQADAYARVVQSCINVKQCVGITIWGVSDKYSWIPGVFKTEGAALLWDENFNKKPAYSSVLNTIQSSKKS